MPLYKRRCVDCNLVEDDRYEAITAEITIECPTCHAVAFTKVYSVPKLPADGLYSFNNALDCARQKASDGHGTQSFRM